MGPAVPPPPEFPDEPSPPPGSPPPGFPPNQPVGPSLLATTRDCECDKMPVQFNVTANATSPQYPACSKCSAPHDAVKCNVWNTKLIAGADYGCYGERGYCACACEKLGCFWY